MDKERYKIVEKCQIFERFIYIAPCNYKLEWIYEAVLEEKKKMFGPHLTLDLYGCNKKKLKDVGFVYEFLDQMPQMIGMTKIMPPYTFQYSGLKPEDWGVSGIVLIAESHISIHTFPEKGFASVDIFSCKEFDTEAASDIVVSKLGAKTYEKNFFQRGRHFPKDMWRNGQAIAMSREQKAVAAPETEG